MHIYTHTHEQMQIKRASVTAVSVSVGLNIHKGKTKVLKYNTENSNPITPDGETLEDVEFFAYLGSIIDERGGSDANVKAGIGKAIEEHMELKTTVNQYQSHNHQYERQDSSTVWS
ncbi:unnamed protein product [Schistosoma curassoni]|uniref:ELFV_dehydrog domain-containing protein n=1 Tax=Schistosoma curassoni TaxID=6186 RepID=A0A183L1V8_9TREM|nr:unnamed protein product [Schistosoma curassoni]